jgi:hypothetical protein
MKLFYGIAAGLSLLLLHACNEGLKQRNEAVTEIAPASPIAATDKNVSSHLISNFMAADTIAQPSGNQTPQSPAGHQQPAPAPNPDWDKKIIKTATVTIEVTNYENFNQLVHNAAKQYGGYIAQEEQNESAYKIENTITMKVPVDQFDHAVAALTPAKEKILVKKITSQDVTGEVVDTRSRMEAKRQARLRYLELLKQAKNMEEILQVQNQVNDIQVEIEGAAGRINYLTHAAAYSTVQLTFYQVLNPQAEHINEPGFGQKILDALGGGLRWIGDLLLLLLHLWPLLAGAGIAWWGFKRWRSKTKPNVS